MKMVSKMIKLCINRINLGKNRLQLQLMTNDNEEQSARSCRCNSKTINFISHWAMRV